MNPHSLNAAAAVTGRRVSVAVLSARDLEPVSRKGVNSAFVVCTLSSASQGSGAGSGGSSTKGIGEDVTGTGGSGSVSFRTEVQPQTNNPVWETSPFDFWLPAVSDGAFFEFQVRHRNKLSRNDLIGTAIVSLASLLQSNDTNGIIRTDIVAERPHRHSAGELSIRWQVSSPWKSVFAIASESMEAAGATTGDSGGVSVPCLVNGLKQAKLIPDQEVDSIVQQRLFAFLESQQRQREDTISASEFESIMTELTAHATALNNQSSAEASGDVHEFQCESCSASFSSSTLLSSCSRAGGISKRGDIRKNHLKRRFAVLTKGHLLLFLSAAHINRGSCQVILHLTPVGSASSKVDEVDDPDDSQAEVWHSDSDPSSFSVRGICGRTLNLVADRLRDAEIWIRLLKAAAQGLVASGDSSVGLSDPHSSVPGGNAGLTTDIGSSSATTGVANLDEGMAFKEIALQIERFADVIHPIDRVRDQIDDLVKWHDPVASWVTLIIALYACLHPKTAFLVFMTSLIAFSLFKSRHSGRALFPWLTLKKKTQMGKVNKLQITRLKMVRIARKMQRLCDTIDRWKALANWQDATASRRFATSASALLVMLLLFPARYLLAVVVLRAYVRHTKLWREFGNDYLPVVRRFFLDRLKDSPPFLPHALQQYAISKLESAEKSGMRLTLNAGYGSLGAKADSNRANFLVGKHPDRSSSVSGLQHNASLAAMGLGNGHMVTQRRKSSTFSPTAANG